MPSAIAAVVLGLFAASAAQFLALMLSGAGPGWVTPFFFSLFLWFALPWTAARFRLRRTGRPYGIAADAKLLAAGILLDALLVYSSLAEGLEYYRKAADFAPQLTYGWIALWLSWQVVLTTWLIQGPLGGDQDIEV